MRAAAAQTSGSGLTLTWALSQLNKQLGGGLDSHLPRVHPRQGGDGAAAARSHDRSQQQTGSTFSSMGCMTPSGADSGTHSPSVQHHHPRSSAQLSVHWAEALEQQAQRAHAPQHTQFAPDKPCLKTHQSSFPFLEEAAQLEGLLRRPRALVLSQLNLEASSNGSAAAAAHAAADKKRSRLAAFGQ